MRHCDVVKCQSAALAKADQLSQSLELHRAWRSAHILNLLALQLGGWGGGLLLISLLMGENYLMSADMFIPLETFLFHTRHLPLTLL